MIDLPDGWFLQSLKDVRTAAKPRKHIYWMCELQHEKRDQLVVAYGKSPGATIDRAISKIIQCYGE